MLGAKARQVQRLRGHLEDAAGAFLALASELEGIHDELKARNWNAAQLRKLRRQISFSLKMAEAFGDLIREADPNAAKALGTAGTAIAKYLPTSLLLAASLSPSSLDVAANVSQVLGVDVAEVVQVLNQGEKAESASDLVIECSVSMILPGPPGETPDGPSDPTDERPGHKDNESAISQGVGSSLDTSEFDPKEIGQHADLRWRDLSGMNLGHAELGEARLGGSDLKGSNLEFSDLRGASLEGADLEGADLTASKLSGGNLRGVDLAGAKLTGADLTGADLTGADLMGLLGS